MQRHYKVSCTRNIDSSTATSRAHPPHPTARLVYWHCFESLLFACTRYDLRFDTFFPPDGGCSEGLDVCVCVFLSHLFVRFVDVPAGVIQKERSHRIFQPFLLRRLPQFLSRKEFSHPFPSSTVKSDFVVCCEEKYQFV